MSGSRSEDDLRGRVDDLEATVRGLTQELVEANERIRQLEEELEADAEPDFIEADDGDEDEETETTAEANQGVEPETEAESDEATEEDDIIVA